MSPTKSICGVMGCGGVTPHQPTWEVWVSVVSFPSGIRGRKRILAYFEGHRTLLFACRWYEFFKQCYMSHLGKAEVWGNCPLLQRGVNYTLLLFTVGFCSATAPLRVQDINRTQIKQAEQGTKHFDMKHNDVRI